MSNKTRQLDRPTPESNRAFKFWPCEQMELVDAEFARKLEHERDEAREHLSAVKHFLNKYIAERDEWSAMCGRYKQERDEAREALKHIGEYGTEEINAAVELRQKLAQALVDLDNMQDQRDLAMKVIKRLERERDEAREALREIEAARLHTSCELRRIATRALKRKI